MLKEDSEKYVEVLDRFQAECVIVEEGSEFRVRKGKNVRRVAAA
jgi:hypothetical protein